MCKVLNARQAGKRPAPDRVYVGRPSKWGNPFVIGRDGSRDEVIAKYHAWIVRQPALCRHRADDLFSSNNAPYRRNVLRCASALGGLCRA
jgi:hypothetical protein